MTNNKQQTAVEQLISKIPLGMRMQLAELGIDFEQAKEMEEEQMIDFAYKALMEADNTVNRFVDVDELYNKFYRGGEQ
jgi:hypothetical protein